MEPEAIRYAVARARRVKTMSMGVKRLEAGMGTPNHPLNSASLARLRESKENTAPGETSHGTAVGIDDSDGRRR